MQYLKARPGPRDRLGLESTSPWLRGLTHDRAADLPEIFRFRVTQPYGSQRN
jgi:hypothetical protein